MSEVRREMARVYRGTRHGRIDGQDATRMTCVLSQIAVAASGRVDLAEVDRLNDSAAYRGIKVLEPACFERLQRITRLGLYFTVQALDLQLTVQAVYSAMIVHLVQSDSRRDKDGAVEEDDAKLDALVD